MTKILHISDTHGFEFKPQKAVDVIIHSGDATNFRNQWMNIKELEFFADWYGKLDIPYKIYVAGNHDSALYELRKESEKILSDNGIIYLNKDFVEINGLKIYGDPTVPEFGDWCFMTRREKIKKHWDLIPNDVNILVTHTPPKNTLDLSFDRYNNLEFCGCGSLSKRIKELKELKANLFGHIHNSGKVKNFGILNRDGIIYSNAAMVVDTQLDKGIQNKGNYFNF